MRTGIADEVAVLIDFEKALPPRGEGLVKLTNAYWYADRLEWAHT